MTGTSAWLVGGINFNSPLLLRIVNASVSLCSSLEVAPTFTQPDLGLVSEPACMLELRMSVSGHPILTVLHRIAGILR